MIRHIPQLQAIRLFVAVALLLTAACSRDPKSQRDSYFNDGQRYLANGRYSEATIQFRNALQVDGAHIPTYFGLAEVFKKTGDSEGAIAIYRKIVSLDPSNIEARLEVGRYFLKAAAYNPSLFRTTESIAREVLALQPSNTDARILLGNAYSGSGDVDESVKQLEEAVSQAPDHLQASISLAAAQIRAKNIEEAERIFKVVLEKHPSSIEALVALATFLAGTGRPVEAEAHFKKAFELAPADSRSLYGLSSFYLSTKRVANAESVFKDAIASKPDAREPYWGLANFYFQQGANDKGTAALVDLLKAVPRDRQAQIRLAESYLNSREPTKAQETITSVLGTYPNDADAHALMGRLWRERGESDKAAIEFDAAIKSNDSLMPPYIEKANLQMAGGNLNGAQETLSTALQRDKENLLVRGFLAKVLALQQKPQDALRESSIVLAKTPNNEDAIVARGDALLSLGSPEEAAREFRKLSEIHPGYPFYWHRLGIAEALGGDSANAIVHLRKAVELKPDMAAAIGDLVLLHAKLNHYDAAAAELDRLSNTSIPADQIHRLRGQIFTAKGDTTTAELEFQKAIELNPTSYANYMTLAELSLARGDLARAMSEVDHLISRNSQLPQAFFMKAYFLQLKNDNVGAITNYRKALALDSESPEVSNNLAWLLSEDSGSLGEALVLARKARRIRPTDPEMADTLGWVYYKMKNYGLAVDQLLFSVNNRTQPGADHYYRLGLAYKAKGDVQPAQAMLRKALQMNPAFAEAADAHRILEARR